MHEFVRILFINKILILASMKRCELKHWLSKLELHLIEQKNVRKLVEWSTFNLPRSQPQDWSDWPISVL